MVSFVYFLSLKIRRCGGGEKKNSKIMTDTVGEKICSNERVYTNISDEAREKYVSRADGFGRAFNIYTRVKE